MTKEKAIKVLNTYDVNFYEYRAEEIADAIDMAIEALKAEPVKHGKWIEGELYIKCSECGYPAGHLSDNYCPNCGCAMTKEKEK